MSRIRGFRILSALALLALLLPGALPAQPTSASPMEPQAAFDCSTVTGIPQTECEALVALYDSTGGGNWTNKTGWLATTTPCSWYRVVCTNSYVTQLNLNSNQLSGTIPSQIGNLTALQSLNLSSNQLSGTIPPQIGNLTTLEGLYLSNNQLSGAIPPQIGNLAALRSLNLSDNQLSGAIPPQIGNLTALQDLELHYNRLSGAIPSQIGNLTALTNLYLHSNQLSGAIPPEIGNLTALQGLYLLVNQLSGAIPPDIGDLTALRYLYLDSNQLSGAIPPQIGNLTALQRLSLYNNQLSGPIPSEIGSLAALRSLYLHNNPLSGEVPAAFTPLTLERLTFYDTNWCVPPTGAVPAWLGTIRSLYGTGLICGEELGSLSGVVSLASRTPASGVQVNLYRSLESDQWRHLDTVQTAGDGAYLFTDLGQGLGIDYRVQFEDPAQRLLSQYYDGQPTIQMATLIAITPGVPRTGIDAVLVEAKFVFLPLVLRQQ